MDTFFASKSKGKSSRGHTCCQLFVTDKGFVYVVPMRRQSDVHLAPKQFAKEVGAPDALICDMAGEQLSDEVRNFCNDIGTTVRALEEGTPWSNKAELYISLLKEAVRKDMRESGSPLTFWDYCVERRARINNLTAKTRFNLHGTHPHMHTFNEEGNISSLYQYSWYEAMVLFPGAKRRPFLRARKSLVVCLVQQEERATRCANGFLRPTERLCLGALSGH